jgi:hypothetical protein
MDTLRNTFTLSFMFVLLDICCSKAAEKAGALSGLTSLSTMQLVCSACVRAADFVLGYS